MCGISENKERECERMDIKMPASVNSWLEHSAAELEYGELTVVFTIHQGQLQYIDKSVREKIKMGQV